MPKKFLYVFLIALLTNLCIAQTATLEKTLSIKEVNETAIPFQNGIPLPSFDKQNRTIINLAGNWKKKRFSANHNITLAKRDVDGYTALINENPNYHLIDYDDSSWEDKILPSVENTINTFPTVPEYYEDGVWYRYKLNVIDSLDGSFVKLMFYAVNYVADVWINGEYIGYHEGGYTPFAFDVSNQIKYSEENTIAIRVDNPPWGTRKDIIPFYRCDWFNYTGIIHDFYLEFTNKVSTLRADVVPQNIDGELLTKIALYNADSITQNINLDFEIFDTKIDEINQSSEYAIDIINEPISITGNTYFTLSIDSNSTYVLNNRLTITDPKLWSINDPNLYVLKITLKQNDKIIDEFFTQFGVRTIERVGDKVLLNNHVVFLTGAARHEDHPIYGRSIPKEEIYNDFLIIDTSNINYVRTAHYPNNPYTYLIADRLGIAVMEEIPIWWFDNEEEWLIQNNERQIHHQMFREMVFKDYNRPSVFFWSTSNECKEETNRVIYNETLVNDLRENFDDKRLITQSSAGDKPGAADITQNPLDVAGWTLYFGIFHGSTYYNGTLVFLSQANSFHSNKPIIDTEFGYWSSEDNSNFQKQVDVFTETFRALEFFSPLRKDGSLNPNGTLAATTWWCVFDWYSHQHANGFQSMGLISMDRQLKKPVYETLKQSYEPYYLNGGTVITDIKEKNEKVVPQNILLNQNYPNPFNPTTIIKYSVPRLSSYNNSNIEISVYNVLGKKISTLVNKVHSAGEYEIEVDGSTLSSGAYFYQIKYDNHIESKKMILMK